MKLFNGEIFGAKEALMTVFEKEWPIKVSFKVAELIAKINTPFENIEKVRNALILKYGVQDKDNSSRFRIDAKLDTYPEFAKKHDELMEQEVEVEFEKVLLPTKVSGEDVVIKPSLLLALENFVELEKEV